MPGRSPRSRPDPVGPRRRRELGRLRGALRFVRGPGLLPYAVAAFFQQGGRRAQIVRIVHDLDGVRDGSVAVPGRSRTTSARRSARRRGAPSHSPRGTKARGATASPSPSPSPRPLTCLGAEPSARSARSAGRVTPAARWLRLVLPDGSRVLRSVNSVQTRGRPGTPAYERVALLDGPVAAAGCPSSSSTRRWTSSTATRCGPRNEHLEGLGLLPAHPNWIGRALRRRIEPRRARRRRSTASRRRT